MFLTGLAGGGPVHKNNALDFFSRGYVKQLAKGVCRPTPQILTLDPISYQ